MNCAVSFRQVSTLIIPSAGVDYHARELDNMRLDVEFEEGEITEEQNAQCRWSADDFAPEGVGLPTQGRKVPGYAGPGEPVGRLGAPSLF